MKNWNIYRDSSIPNEISIASSLNTINVRKNENSYGLLKHSGTFSCVKLIIRIC